LLVVGGPTNLATHQSIARVLPAGELRAVYGTTEAFPAASIGSGEVMGETSALTEKGAGLCLGWTLPGIDAAIIDFGGAGRHADVGDVGEICLRGPAVAPCENLIFEDSKGLWQRTGDLGWRDRQGRLWLVARQARVALTRFGPAYPVSCEQVFETHDRVRRAVVVGVGRVGEQEAVLVVEPAAGAWPKDDLARISFQKELLEMGQSKGITREIRRALFVKRMPLDRLHHAQPRIDEVMAWLERTGGVV
jgi:acyl-CoA synthetase (AMP-forming)/AMP-acid ligase II